jgi:hypothetical protein
MHACLASWRWLLEPCGQHAKQGTHALDPAMNPARLTLVMSPPSPPNPPPPQVCCHSLGRSLHASWCTWQDVTAQGATTRCIACHNGSRNLRKPAPALQPQTMQQLLGVTATIAASAASATLALAATVTTFSPHAAVSSTTTTAANTQPTAAATQPAAACISCTQPHDRPSL